MLVTLQFHCSLHTIEKGRKLFFSQGSLSNTEKQKQISSVRSPMLLCWFYLIPSLYEKGSKLVTFGSFEECMSCSLLAATMVILFHFPDHCEIGLSLFRVLRIKRHGDGDQMEEQYGCQVEYVYL